MDVHFMVSGTHFGTHFHGFSLFLFSFSKDLPLALPAWNFAAGAVSVAELPPGESEFHNLVVVLWVSQSQKRRKTWTKSDWKKSAAPRDLAQKRKQRDLGIQLLISVLQLKYLSMVHGTKDLLQSVSKL